MTIELFYTALYLMIAIAVVVFIALYFVDAGYGMFNTARWGKTVSNRVGWTIMEAPVFCILVAMWICSDRNNMLVPSMMLSLMVLHYFNRAFIYPSLFPTKSRMPVAIVCMAITFNLINGTLQGGWLMYLAPIDMYTAGWLQTPQFIGGLLLFFTGMAINIHSDKVIRNLRKPGDTRHYLPQKGLYKYVTSANYFGELVEWTGFAILTWSLSGAVFAIWTFANLVPRANAIYKRYRTEFGDEVGKRKRIIPFIY
ncbi:MAG: DUF1295 domain-containing protein [Tannerellaceae bacterium]|nr:DUF1295 domain-containing protein [Tannerellaceae bacterium]